MTEPTVRSSGEMTEIDRDHVELDAIISAFAAAMPGHERDVVVFVDLLLAAHNRQVIARLARQLRAGGFHVEVESMAIVFDVGKPPEAPILQRVFMAMLGFFRNRRRGAAIRAGRP